MKRLTYRYRGRKSDYVATVRVWTDGRDPAVLAENLERVLEQADRLKHVTAVVVTIPPRRPRT